MQKYPKPSEVVHPNLLVFTNVYMAEADFNHVNSTLMKQRNKFHVEHCDSLRFELTTWRPTLQIFSGVTN